MKKYIHVDDLKTWEKLQKLDIKNLVSRFESRKIINATDREITWELIKKHVGLKYTLIDVYDGEWWEDWGIPLPSKKLREVTPELKKRLMK